MKEKGTVKRVVRYGEMALKKRTGLVVAIAITAVVTCLVVVAVALERTSAARLFRRYVMDPIPDSVADLKVQGSNWWSYTYVFRFSISRADVDSIIASRPFQKVQDVSYARGNLYFAWSPTHVDGVALYPQGGQPSWFDPESWDTPETYAWHETKIDAHTQLLLYNEALGTAYFIVSSDN